MDLILRNARLLDPPPDRADAPAALRYRRRRRANRRDRAGASAAYRETGPGKPTMPSAVWSAAGLSRPISISTNPASSTAAPPEAGRDARAVARVAAVKHTMTVEDVHARARATLEQAILHGTTRMRTHVEIDPGIGLRGYEGVAALVDEYKWAIDLEICAFPQEGLTNNPGTYELIAEALRRGARAVGAAPGYDTDHAGQIRQIFALARAFDAEIDMHLDFGNEPHDLDVDLVCDLTEAYGMGGRVAVGHMTKLAVLPPERTGHDGAAARRCRGRGDRIAGDRPVPDGPRPGPCRAPRRRRRQSAARARGQLLDLEQQHPQPVHPLSAIAR